ncbi:hypothetical protein D3C76_557950 [compost metagenome]
MGADGHVELGGHQQHNQHFVEATQAGGVQLTEVQRASLEHLLEHHPVVAVFARGHADRRNALADAGVPEDVVGAGRLFDPQGLEGGQAAHVSD